MPTSQLSTSSVTSDHKKGRQATNLFRAAYDKASLDTKRAQALNENPAFPKALLHLIEQCSAPKVDLVAPKGGRIHLIYVPVNPARSWKDAAGALPNTSWSSSHLREAENVYLPIEGQTEQREIVLVNFGETIANGQIALDWAEVQGLRRAGPREVFAVCEHRISLHTTIGVSFLRVVSTVTCEASKNYHLNIYAPAAFWSGASRLAEFIQFDKELESYNWFAFTR